MASPAISKAYAVQMRGITKAFAGIKALDGVDLDLLPGEINCLLGENGAGKSTLIKILSGAHTMDSGEMYLFGEKITLSSPKAARDAGIVPIYQELDLVDCLSVAENIFMCNEPLDRWGLVDRKAMEQKAAQAMADLGFDFDVRRPVGSLSVAHKQMVAIAKALSMESKVLILDEPSDVLTGKELKVLFETIARIKEKGIGIIYISHRLEEVFEIGDTATILRDGTLVDRLPVSELDRPKLIQKMVGRAVTHDIPLRHGDDAKPVVMEVRSLCQQDTLYDISLKLRAGEVLGIFGLVGAGRTELAKAIIGETRLDKGEILMDGTPVRIDSPEKACRLKIGYVPEDRKNEGLVLIQSIEKNTVLPLLGTDKVSKHGFLKGKAIRQVTLDAIKALNTKCSGPQQTVKNLSGGNQQKVVIAKWLSTGARVLILDEPTRGIDVGAKSEIYDIIKNLTAQGCAVLLISSEMPELMSLSDRIMVLSEGHVTRELDSNQITEAELLENAMPRALKGDVQ